ncbi:MAG: hypothetical protein EXR20_04015, partial [Bacteroidetes bacterium]|nr:hypothetical protein [Bacteroidota bacterium]
MSRIYLTLFIGIIFSTPYYLSSQITENRKVFISTPTYAEIISTYTNLVKGSKIAQFKAHGLTDVGKPLHLLVLSVDGKFDPASNVSKTKILINN